MSTRWRLTPRAVEGFSFVAGNSITVKVCTLNQPSGQQSQDRVSSLETSDGLYLFRADGAGGVSGGSEAAEAFVRAMEESARRSSDPRTLVAAFRKVDSLLDASRTAGETTGIAVCIGEEEILGASVGDSQAWLITDDEVYDLTEHQERKPLLGSGAAAPTVFALQRRSGVLVVASDGLFKYTSAEKITALVRERHWSPSLQEFGALVRLASGALQDDLSVALVELP